MNNTTHQSDFFWNVSVTSANVSKVIYVPLPLVHLRTWIAVSLLISLLGGVLCLLLLAVIISKRSLRSGTGILICHSIATQLLLCSFFFPSTWISKYMALIPGFQFGLSCKSLMYMFYSTVHITFWGEFFLAMNRVVGTLYPHYYTQVTTKKVIVSMILISWAIGLANSLPFYFGIGGKFGTMPPSEACAAVLQSYWNIQVYNIIGGYIPGALIGASYLAIMIKAVIIFITGRRVKPSKDQPKALTNPQKVAKRRLFLARTLLVSFLWQNLCYSPLSVLTVFYLPVYIRYVPLQFWLSTIYCCGFALNPVVFFGLNADYRKGLKELLANLHIINHQKRSGVTVATGMPTSERHPTD